MFEKYKFLLLLFYLHSIYGEYLTVTKFSDQYDPSWESLDKRPLPKWYDEAKVGIFIHWGVYAVPSFGTEWFWTNWKDAKVPSYVEFMEKNYKPGFTYQDFAVDFTAELFNSTEWALLFEKSGAKYVVITSKHHEGYALWPSKYSYSWNSVDVGPHRDILNELSTAIRQKTKMKFGVYYSLFEWFNRLYLDDKSSNFKKHDFVQLKIWPEIKELVETYHPEVLWSDGDWEAIYKYWKSEELLAWLYNESPVKETIVTNDRWGIGTLCEHGDFYTCSDRYNPGVLVSHKWENAFTIDRKSWGNRGNAKFEDFLTTYEVIKELVTTISCGGNVLVNVGPTKAGTIEPIFVERLLEMGNWLKVNGEAIYSSTPWEYQNDTITPDIWYTASKTTYPMNVFATVLKYPLVTNTIAMFAFGNVNQQIENVTLLGFSGSIAWQRSGSTLVIVFPSKNEVDAADLQHGWVFKIKMGL